MTYATHVATYRMKEVCLLYDKIFKVEVCKPFCDLSIEFYQFPIAETCAQIPVKWQDECRKRVAGIKLMPKDYAEIEEDDPISGGNSTKSMQQSDNAAAKLTLTCLVFILSVLL